MLITTICNLKCVYCRAYIMVATVKQMGSIVTVCGVMSFVLGVIAENKKVTNTRMCNGIISNNIFDHLNDEIFLRSL